jgi:hypothetical protein
VMASITRFKIREITQQAKGISIETTVKRLATYMVDGAPLLLLRNSQVLIGLIRWVRLRHEMLKEINRSEALTNMLGWICTVLDRQQRNEKRE